MKNSLLQLLADTYVLSVKTQNFHWNVTGPQFYSYHKLFEDQYDQLTSGIDKIAEHIRSFQIIIPGSLAAFLKFTCLKESDISSLLKSDQMVKKLLSDHELISNNITNLFNIGKEWDEVTLDLLTERKSEHDQAAWMLRSSLG
jgi:starvation-inducible DNA-binding protein